jgi:hypothetical protein
MLPRAGARSALHMRPIFAVAHAVALVQDRALARTKARLIWAQMSRPATNCNRNFFRTCALGITWEGTPVPDFTGTVAVASATAAMLFMLAVTLGFISPSPRAVEVSQTVAQKHFAD